MQCLTSLEEDTFFYTHNYLSCKNFYNFKCVIYEMMIKDLHTFFSLFFTREYFSCLYSESMPHLNVPIGIDGVLHILFYPILRRCSTSGSLNVKVYWKVEPIVRQNYVTYTTSPQQYRSEHP